MNKEQMKKGKAYPFAFMHEVYEEIDRLMKESVGMEDTIPGTYLELERTVGMNAHSLSALKRGVT